MESSPPFVLAKMPVGAMDCFPYCPWLSILPIAIMSLADGQTTEPAIEIEPSLPRITYLPHLNIFPDAMSYKKMKDLCGGYLKIRVEGLSHRNGLSNAPARWKEFQA
jgi:hypothetical protein